MSRLLEHLRSRFLDLKDSFALLRPGRLCCLFAGAGSYLHGARARMWESRPHREWTFTLTNMQGGLMS